jgi:benzoyl-CoA 2,3-dioxygenase component A
MNTPDTLVRQHLIDPEQCIRCGSCEDACTKKAISHTPNCSIYAIDSARCDACLECIDVCSTGAVDSWRYVPANEAYTVETQFEWTQLPAETVTDPSLPPPRILHGPPPSAATPKIMLHTPESPAVARVVENRRLCTDGADSDIRHLVLQADGMDFPILEGQSLGVLPPGTDNSGQPHAMRIYSIASTRDGERGETGHIALTVKRVTEDYEGRPVRGICSNHLCDLQRGEIVRLVGPLGNSYLMPDDPNARLLMICTGAGIAPMRGMIERRKQMRSATVEALRLYIGARTVAELPYREELHASAEAGLIDLRVAYSRQADAPRRYVQDLLAEEGANLATALTDSQTYIYICGLKKMESGVMDVFRNVCHAQQLDWDRVHDDLRTQHRLHIEVY